MIEYLTMFFAFPQSIYTWSCSNNYFYDHYSYIPIPLFHSDFLKHLILDFIHFSIFHKSSELHFLLSLVSSCTENYIIIIFFETYIHPRCFSAYYIYQTTKNLPLLSSSPEQVISSQIVLINSSVPLKTRIYFGFNIEGLLKGILLISTISGAPHEWNFLGCKERMVIGFILLHLCSILIW